MKTLYLIRHAKSDWSDSTLSDFARPLNKRGKKNAPFMGELLAKIGIKPDLILSSPAERAKTTALIIADKVGYAEESIQFDEELYGAWIEEIEHVLKQVPDSKENVFLFGHNPGLTEFAAYISGYAIDNIPTCGIFCVKLKEDSWKNPGKNGANFVSFEYPKKHKDS